MYTLRVVQRHITNKHINDITMNHEDHQRWIYNWFEAGTEHNNYRNCAKNCILRTSRSYFYLMILCEIYDAVDFVKLSCEQCFNKLIVAPDLIVNGVRTYKFCYIIIILYILILPYKWKFCHFCGAECWELLRNQK